MIPSGQDICGLQVAMDKSFAVKIFERIQNRAEHVARFFWRKRALGKNLREILFRIFHHQIQQIASAEAASPRAEEP